MAIGGAVMLVLFGIATAAAASYDEIVYTSTGWTEYKIKPEVTTFLGLMTVIGIVLMVVGLAIEGRKPMPDISLAHYLQKMDAIDKQEAQLGRVGKAPKFCPQCGEALNDQRARFCSRCGERLT